MSTYSLLLDWAVAPSYYSLAGVLLVIAAAMRTMLGPKQNPRGLPLPPGPKGYPIIGNLFEMPAYKPWLVFDDWSKTYGDMIYFNILGRHFLVLNNLERTYDLFEKRSSNYSDRMIMPMLGELMKMEYNLAMVPYGEWWRQHRRTFHQHFHTNAVARYLPIQRRETRAMLNRLLYSPADFIAHIRQAFGATIMNIVYGININGSHDTYISNAEQAIKGMDEASVPGRFLVDFLPFLKYVPSWVPGASFQKKAAYWRKINEAVRNKPFEHVKEGMANGTADPSMCATLLARLPEEIDPTRHEKETIARNITALAYVAGADTTVSAVESFLLAMAMHPDAQRNGHAEIDAIIGQGRLPDFDDRDALPYINALVRETFRWQMVAPITIHLSSADDEYNGYFIPKGTVLMANSWAILHDPKIYDDPLEFKPERYLRKDGRLDPNVRDPSSVAFGFGRRICPGRHMSDNSLYLTIASILATFDIQPPLDAQGKSIQLKPKVTGGLLSHPESFECIITPRSPAAAALIQMDNPEIGLDE